MTERFPLLSMGETAEEVATKWGIGREEQDAFALSSQRRAGDAVLRGAFAKEIVSVSVPSAKKGAPPTVFDRDECPRPEVTMEALAKLPAAFRKGGTVTAGNSSPTISDGASAHRDRERGGAPDRQRVEPARARRRPRDGNKASTRTLMGEGPIPAGRRQLARAGWNSGRSRPRRAENEAFAAQSLACIQGLDGSTRRRSTFSAARSRSATPDQALSGARITSPTLAHAMVCQRKRDGACGRAVYRRRPGDRDAARAAETGSAGAGERERGSAPLT